jgi:NTP pyrophosphatase (non-canonical NTP hydrolase)
MKIDELTREVLKFRDERNWKRYHNPKDLIIKMMTEVGELAEHFTWRKGKELDDYIKKNKSEIENELSDVLYHILLIAHELKIDIPKAFLAKMEQNKKKYPVSKTKGKYKKYTQYQ